MANLRIVDLPNGTTLTGAEFFEIVQGGNSYKGTLAQVLAYVGGGGGVTWPLVSTDGNLSFGSNIGTEAYIDDSGNILGGSFTIPAKVSINSDGSVTFAAGQTNFYNDGTFSFPSMYSTVNLIGISKDLYLNGNVIRPSNTGDPIASLNSSTLIGTDSNSNPYIQSNAGLLLGFSSDGTRVLWNNDNIAVYDGSNNFNLLNQLYANGHLIINEDGSLYFANGNSFNDTNGNIFGGDGNVIFDNTTTPLQLNYPGLGSGHPLADAYGILYWGGDGGGHPLADNYDVLHLRGGLNDSTDSSGTAYSLMMSQGSGSGAIWTPFDSSVITAAANPIGSSNGLAGLDSSGNLTITGNGSVLSATSDLGSFIDFFLGVYDRSIGLFTEVDSTGNTAKIWLAGGDSNGLGFNSAGLISINGVLPDATMLAALAVPIDSSVPAAWSNPVNEPAGLVQLFTNGIMVLNPRNDGYGVFIELDGVTNFWSIADLDTSYLSGNAGDFCLVTNASAMPFRIDSGALDGSLYIDSSGNINLIAQIHGFTDLVDSSSNLWSSLFDGTGGSVAFAVLAAGTNQTMVANNFVITDGTNFEDSGVSAASFAPAFSGSFHELVTGDGGTISLLGSGPYVPGSDGSMSGLVAFQSDGSLGGVGGTSTQFIMGDGSTLALSGTASQVPTTDGSTQGLAYLQPDGGIGATDTWLVTNLTMNGWDIQSGGASPRLLLATDTRVLYASDGTTAALDFNTPGVIKPPQAPTASAPTYVKGGMYFDTTLNKLRIGGASGWETVTSV